MSEDRFHASWHTATAAAATGHVDVKALVHINAYVPDQGETVSSLSSGSALDDQSVFTAVPLVDTHTLVDLYIKQHVFPAIFAAGASNRVTSVLAAGQRPLTTSALGEAALYLSAWRTIPSYDVIGTEDEVIPLASQESMAPVPRPRAEGQRPHLSRVTNPWDVTDLITTAATAHCRAWPRARADSVPGTRRRQAVRSAVDSTPGI